MLLVFANVGLAQVQQFTFESLQINNTNVVFQDSKGFVWIGTTDGLFRYDGNSINNYEIIVDKRFKPSDKRIWCFAEDSAHNIWIGTQTGICYYSYLTQEITDVPAAGQQQFFPNCAFTTNDGAVYFGTNYFGVLKVVKNDQTPSGFQFEVLYDVSNDTIKLTSKLIINLFTDTQKSLWAVTADGSFYKLNKSNSFTKLASNQNSKYDFLFVEQAEYLNSKNSVFLLADLNEQVTATAFIEVQLNSDSLVFHEVESDAETKKILAKRFAFDNNNKIWIATESEKPIRCDVNYNNKYLTLSNPLFTASQPDERLNYKVSSNSKVAYVDHFNRLWLATKKELLFLNIDGWQFQQAGIYGSVLGKLNNKNCDFIHFNKKGFEFLSTIEDSLILSGMQGKQTTFKLVNENNLGIYEIYKDTNNDLYLATFNGLKFLPASLLKKPNSVISIPECSELPFQKKIDSIAGTVICSRIIHTKNNTLVFNSSNELYEIDSDRNNIHKLIYAVAKNDGLVRCIAALDNLIFVGTDNHLYAFEYGTNNPVELKQLTPDFKILEDKYIAELYKSVNGNLLVGTNRGLFQYQPATKKIDLITPTDFTIKAIAEDAQKNIWMAVQGKGLYNWNPVSKKLICYNHQDGLLSDLFSEGCKITALSNGALMFLTAEGLNYFFPDSLIATELQSNMQLIEIEINNKSVLLRPDSLLKNKRESILQQQQLVLAPFENTLNITLGNIVSVAPHKINYQLKLEGFDKEWVDYQNFQTAYYKDLPPYRYSFFFPGSYAVLVKLISEDHSKEVIEKLLTVCVKVSFMKSIEFYALVGLLFLAVLIYVVRYFAQLQLREKLREQEKLLAIERERNRISEDLHDDLGAGLSSIAMMTAVMKDLITDEESKETAEEVTVEANELVGRMREIIWSMNSKNDTLENLMTYMHEYCNKYLLKNKIELHFEIQGAIPQQDIRGDKRENIFLVVKETLHNAVKYAETKKVSITIIISKNQLHVTVNDHGKGFDMNNIKRFGNGLDNMKQRILKAEGTCEIKSAPGMGTTTFIAVPL